MSSRNILFVVVAAAGLVAGRAQTARSASEPVVWRVDNLKEIAGHAPTVLGSPRAIVEAGVRALRFNGASDGLIMGRNPIEGCAAFTIEVRFKPDSDGPPAQRFVHVEDANQNRALIETRVTADKQWYLDTFLYSHATRKGVTLVDV